MIKFTNNATTTLAGSLTNVATSMTVATGDGAKFPTLSGSDYFLTTLVKVVSGAPVVEIVKVTARTGDVFTIVRGQEGTTATTFSVADRAELRITRDTMGEFPQKTENSTFSGNNIFNGTTALNGATTASAKVAMTGGSGAAIDEAKGANVASAGTIDLTNTTGNMVHITGTTTITAITIPSGAERTIVFDGILTLTHNATTLILPGASNITTAAGDVAKVRGDGSGNARVVSYQRANGMPVASITPSAVSLLATLTPTAAANVDALNVFTSAYDAYVVIFEGLLPATDDTMSIRFANGGVVDTSTSYLLGSNSAPALTSTLNFSFNVYASGIGVTGELKIANTNSASSSIKAGNVVRTFNKAAAQYQTNNNEIGYIGGALSGLRFYWNGGANFQAVGKILIYGVKNS